MGTPRHGPHSRVDDAPSVPCRGDSKLPQTSVLTCWRAQPYSDDVVTFFNRPAGVRVMVDHSIEERETPEDWVSHQ